MVRETRSFPGLLLNEPTVIRGLRTGQLFPAPDLLRAVFFADPDRLQEEVDLRLNYRLGLYEGSPVLILLFSLASSGFRAPIARAFLDPHSPSLREQLHCFSAHRRPGVIFEYKGSALFDLRSTGLRTLAADLGPYVLAAGNYPVFSGGEPVINVVEKRFSEADANFFAFVPANTGNSA